MIWFRHYNVHIHCIYTLVMDRHAWVTTWLCTYQFWIDMIEIPFEGFTGEMFAERDSVRDVSIIDYLCLRSLFEEILLKIEFTTVKQRGKVKQINQEFVHPPPKKKIYITSLFKFFYFFFFCNISNNFFQVSLTLTEP